MFRFIQIPCDGVGSEQICEETRPAQLRSEQRAPRLLVSGSGRRGHVGRARTQTGRRRSSSLVANKEIAKCRSRR